MEPNAPAPQSLSFWKLLRGKANRTHSAEERDQLLLLLAGVALIGVVAFMMYMQSPLSRMHWVALPDAPASTPAETSEPVTAPADEASTTPAVPELM